MQHHPADLPDELPAAQSPQEQAYQALLLALHADRQKLKSNMNARYHDMIRILHRVGASDQNAHRSHSPGAAERGYRRCPAA